MQARSHAATHMIRLLAGVVVPLGIFLLPAGAQSARGCCTVAQPQPLLQRTFKVSAAPELAIDNINGHIHVIGDSSGEIRLTAEETVRGDSNEDIARAKREVRLGIEQSGDSLSICVNGPFRHGSNSGNSACQNSGIDGDRDYSVRFDFDLHVPPGTRVQLRTVNDGNLKIERVSGAFDLHNVNGGIDLDQVSGAGDAKTVNGDIHATFAANPGANCSFSTVNGALHMYFKPELAAELHYKTLNGDVYTDFAMTPVGDMEDGASRFRRGRSATGQVGSGGPEIDLNTLNGNIFIHRAS